MDRAPTPASSARVPEPAQDGWEGRIARGFRLARVCGEVLSSDRRLLALPLLAALCSLLALIAAASLGRRLLGGSDAVGVIAPAWFAAYAVSFVTIFFNVALVHVIAARWRGEQAGVGRGLAIAARRAVAVAGWAVLTTTVGLALQLLQRLTLGASRLVFGIVAGGAWSVASFFVVPVLALERRGPLRALRRSTQLVRERRADGLAGATPIALAMATVLLPILALALIGAVLFAMDVTLPGLTAMGVALAAGVALWVVSVALSQVFALAVYQHATGAPCHEDFAAADLERPREGRLLGRRR